MKKIKSGQGVTDLGTQMAEDGVDLTGRGETPPKVVESLHEALKTTVPGDGDSDLSAVLAAKREEIAMTTARALGQHTCTFDDHGEDSDCWVCNPYAQNRPSGVTVPEASDGSQIVTTPSMPKIARDPLTDKKYEVIDRGKFAEVIGDEGTWPELEPDIIAHLRRIGWTEVVRVPRLGACWEWDGARLEERGGYGEIRIGGKVLRAHRVAYQAWVEDPGDLHVLHHCDNPPCMRPLHLFSGTDADNAADKVAKGRGVSPVYASQDAPAAKLTSEDVVIVRQLIAEGLPLAEIGRQFYVTRQAVWRIKQGQTWTPEKMSN